MMHAPGKIITSKTIGWLFKLVFSFAAFWFALRDVDVVHVLEILKTQSHEGVVWAVILLLTQVVLGAFRWHVITQAIAMANERVFTMVEALRMYYIGVFFNCCLPGGTVGGDVVRAWLAKTDELSARTAVASVIIDRLVALLALGILVLLTLPALDDIIPFDASFWLPVLLAAAVISLWLTLRMKVFLRRFQHLRPARWLLHFIDCLQVMLLRPKATLISVLFSIGSHLAFCLCMFALARGLNVELTVMQSITLIPVVILLVTLPISVGGWGFREAGMVGMLGLIGIPPAAALTISLEYGIINILTCLPGVWVWLMYRKNKPQPLPVS